jgi:hypothetical protein
MPKTMDQGLFDAGAFGATMVYIDEKLTGEQPAGAFEKFLSGLSEHYGRKFKGDDFIGQWRELAPQLDAALQGIGGFSNPIERRKAFHLYFELARKYNPDGTKVKKLFGVFGGLLFEKPHMDTGVRPDMCLKNLTNYFVLGEKKTFGTEYFDREEQ